MTDPTGSQQSFPSLSSRAFKQNVIHALSIIIHVPNKVQDILVYRVPFGDITPAEPDNNNNIFPVCCSFSRVHCALAFGMLLNTLVHPAVRHVINDVH